MTAPFVTGIGFEATLFGVGFAFLLWRLGILGPLGFFVTFYLVLTAGFAALVVENFCGPALANESRVALCAVGIRSTSRAMSGRSARR